jgi:hypothetical protein
VVDDGGGEVGVGVQVVLNEALRLKYGTSNSLNSLLQLPPPPPPPPSSLTPIFLVFFVPYSVFATFANLNTEHVRLEVRLVQTQQPNTEISA